MALAKKSSVKKFYKNNGDLDVLAYPSPARKIVSMLCCWVLISFVWTA
jgi:hypothetical protein